MRVLLIFFALISVLFALRVKATSKESGFFDSVKQDAMNQIRDTGNNIVGGVKKKVTENAVNKISGSLF